MMQYWLRKMADTYLITLVLLSQVYVKVYCLALKSEVIECQEDKECRGTYVCKKGHCVPATDTAEIHAKQPCPHIFKGKCHSDDQCFCEEVQLQCIHHECVPGPPPNTIHQNHGSFCDSHIDCDAGHLCDKSKCRLANSYAELVQVLAEITGCSSDSDCLPGQVCADKVCHFNNYKKDEKMKELAQSCIVNRDCSVPQVCDNFVCRKTNSVAELQLLLDEIKVCIIDKHCPIGLECYKNVCVTKRSSDIAQCIRNTEGAICLDHSFCQTCVSDVFKCKDFRCRLNEDGI